jgi:hypothetical protein
MAKVLGMAKFESGWNTLNVTDMNGRGTDGRRDKKSPETFETVMKDPSITVNHMTNFGLLQMSADRFAIHPVDSMNSLRRTFLDGNGLQALPVDPQNPTYFAANFEKYLGLPAIEDQEFFAKCGTPKSLQSHPGFKGLGKELPSLAEKIPLISRLVRGGGTNTSGADRETVKYFGRLLTACPRLNYELAFNEVQRDGMKPRYFETRDKPGICQNEIEALLKAPSSPPTPIVAVTAPSPAPAPAPAPAAVVTATPQAPTSRPRDELLDSVFRQDALTANDRANTENPDAAAKIARLKNLREIVVKPEAEIQGTDSRGLADARRAIEESRKDLSSRLKSIDDQISKEKNDDKKAELRRAYSQIREQDAELKKVSAELGSKLRTAGQMSQADQILKDFNATRSVEAWGGGLVNTLDKNNAREYLMDLQRRRVDSTLSPSDKADAEKAWATVQAGRKAGRQEWELDKETARLSKVYEKADAEAQYKDGKPVAINLKSPQDSVDYLILLRYQRLNNSTFAPSEQFIRKTLAEAQEAVRMGGAKSVADYLKGLEAPEDEESGD